MGPNDKRTGMGMWMTGAGHQSLEDSNQSEREARHNQGCLSSTWWRWWWRGLEWSPEPVPFVIYIMMSTPVGIVFSISIQNLHQIVIAMSFVWILWRSLMGQNKWGLHHWIPQKSCCSDSKRNGNASPSVANFTFTFYWLPDGRSGWTGKRHLIDQVHSKCSTSKWIMNADLSLLSGDNIFHLFEFGPNVFQPIPEPTIAKTA